MITKELGLTVFFCIGSAKSGTTLLARVLDQHPQIACLWESYALRHDARTSIFNPASDNWNNHGFAAQDVRRWAEIWNAQPRAFLRRALRRLTGQNYFVASPFRQTMPRALADFAQRCNANVVGDKWPVYIKHIDNVLQVFPNAKFIYNVRDPRGVWNSAQKFHDRQRGDELLKRMLENDKLIAPYLERPNFFSLRYEDLVCNPGDTVRRLYELLGCEFSSAYLHYDRQADPYPDRWSWVPQASDQFDPRHTTKWKEQVKPSDTTRITELASWFIEKYQYEG